MWQVHMSNVFLAVYPNNDINVTRWQVHRLGRNKPIRSNLSEADNLPGALQSKTNR